MLLACILLMIYPLRVNFYVGYILLIKMQISWGIESMEIDERKPFDQITKLVSSIASQSDQVIFDIDCHRLWIPLIGYPGKFAMSSHNGDSSVIDKFIDKY